MIYVIAALWLFYGYWCAALVKQHAMTEEGFPVLIGKEPQWDVAYIVACFVVGPAMMVYIHLTKSFPNIFDVQLNLFKKKTMALLDHPINNSRTTEKRYTAPTPAPVDPIAAFRASADNTRTTLEAVKTSLDQSATDFTAAHGFSLITNVNNEWGFIYAIEINGTKQPVHIVIRDKEVVGDPVSPHVRQLALPPLYSMLADNLVFLQSNNTFTFIVKLNGHEFKFPGEMTDLNKHIVAVMAYHGVMEAYRMLNSRSLVLEKPTDEETPE